MECNMKQQFATICGKIPQIMRKNSALPNRDIIEQISTALCPLRRSKTRAQAQAGAETAIEMLREAASRPFPRSDSIKKATGKLREVLEPLGDAQMPFWRGDRPMTIRDALDWFEGLEGPSKVDILKRFVATQADCLVNEFSQEPPTATVDGQVSEVASLLYEAVTGEEDVKLKHQVDAVRRSWRRLNLKPEARGR